MSKRRLPVIVSLGGVNAAGRSSGHHAYRRMVLDKLGAHEQQQTLTALAAMRGLSVRDHYSDAQRAEILAGTLIRRVEKNHFDPDQLPWMSQLETQDRAGRAMEFECRPKQLPRDLPPNWQVHALSDDRVSVRMTGPSHLYVPNTRVAPVQAAGQLPSGFDPAALYPSRFHPRGLQMSVLAASDALNNMGLPWETLRAQLPADDIAVYAGSVMAQLDQHGYGGLLQARMRGGRVSSKQLPLGLNTMPADFVNAYVLGSLGATGSVTGACATFLYNLRMAVEDIQAGRRRLVFVGNAEAPLTPEVFEGYGAMGALASDEGLCKLDQSERADHRRASRPFGENCGFTLAESAQFVVLMDDELAIELGADILGAVSDVFINADGYKKSISAPGPGNYITLAKSMAASAALLGEAAVRDKSYIQAHGSSTPQNRVTESRILNKMAQTFGISAWPVSAVKAYVGHSLAPASADQLLAVLGQFAYGWLPGLKTTSAIAGDVHQDHLHLPLDDLELPEHEVAFINSKGFGGNNASAAIIHPNKVRQMLTQRYGSKTMQAYQGRCEQTRGRAIDYENALIQGDWQVRYRFGEDMIDEADLTISRDRILLPGWEQAIDLPKHTPYQDLRLD